MPTVIHEQRAVYKRLKTVPERAQYLLDSGVYAISDIENLELIYRPVSAGIMLPLTASTAEEAVKKGTAWLKEKRDNAAFYRDGRIEDEEVMA